MKKLLYYKRIMKKKTIMNFFKHLEKVKHPVYGPDDEF